MDLTEAYVDSSDRSGLSALSLSWVFALVALFQLLLQCKNFVYPVSHFMGESISFFGLLLIFW